MAKDLAGLLAGLKANWASESHDQSTVAGRAVITAIVALEVATGAITSQDQAMADVYYDQDAQFYGQVYRHVAEWRA